MLRFDMGAYLQFPSKSTLSARLRHNLGKFMNIV